MPESGPYVPLSAEYHDAHLAFARAHIVEAAANREPILARLRAYTLDVERAAQDRHMAALREEAIGRSSAGGFYCKLCDSPAWNTAEEIVHDGSCLL